MVLEQPAIQYTSLLNMPSTSQNIITTNKIKIGSNLLTGVSIGSDPVRRIKIGSQLKYELENFTIATTQAGPVASTASTLSLSSYVTSNKTNVDGTSNVGYSPTTISIPANPTSSARTLTYTITQNTSNLTQTMYVYQDAGTSLSVNPNNITVNGSFAITANKSWTINTNWQAYNYITSATTTNPNAIETSKTAGSGNDTVVVYERSFPENSLVRVRVVSQEQSANVLVCPSWKFQTISSWSPSASSATIIAVTDTNYPTITYSSSASWLSGSGTNISVQQNTTTSSRTATITVTGSISGTFFGVTYSSSQSRTITVTQAGQQQIQDVYLYVLLDKNDPGMVYLSDDETMVSSYSAPTNINISIQANDGRESDYAQTTIYTAENDAQLSWSLGYVEEIETSQVYPTSYNVGNYRYHINGNVILLGDK